jgi:hypothetical protein
MPLIILNLNKIITLLIIINYISFYINKSLFYFNIIYKIN